ncbi:MAG: toprim domain-containing protein [Candidatus Paceibacterota bacterium]|jgi:recombination protein RecR
MNASDKLEEYFRKFPGIGGRQAKRFVYFLLTQRNGFTKELADLLISLRKEVSQCSECFRFFTNSVDKKICPTCNSKTADQSTIIVVEKDADFETVQKSGTFDGHYFVLGGLIPLMEKDPSGRIRIKELVERVKRDGEKEIVKEIILALSLNAEGENTTQYVSKTLEPLAAKYGFKISTLGRGFSTGLELEYSDADTLGNALRNRA